MLVPGRRGDREGEEGGSTSRLEASCRRSGEECDRAAQGGRDRGCACGAALRTGGNVSANAARASAQGGDAALVLATGAAALEPPASIAKLGNEQLTHDHSTPSQVEGQTLLTGSAGCQPRGCGLSVDFPIAETGDDGPGWMAIWFGVLLMALGLVSVLSASRPLRRTLLLGDGCDGVGRPWQTTNSGTVFQLRSNMFKRVVTKPERLKAVVSSPSTAAGPRRPDDDGVRIRRQRPSSSRTCPATVMIDLIGPGARRQSIPRFNALDQMAVATAQGEVRDVALAAKGGGNEQLQGLVFVAASPQIDRQATASGHFSAVTNTQRVLKPQRDENYC